MHLKISINEARRLVLQSQGLLQNNFGKNKKGVLSAIEHLGYVQIDTLAVVERAHHHTLWSRLPDYSPGLLEELQAKEHKIFEYWSHAASYLPMSDYRFTLPRKAIIAAGESHWFKRDDKMMRYVLDRIKQEGPLLSKDFMALPNKKTGPWYEWKPAKKALEQLFMEGKLMVAKRQGFQKVYDLPERILPAGVNTTMPTLQEFCEHLIRKNINAHGLVSEQEIVYLRKKLKEPVKSSIKRLLKQGEIIAVKIEGLNGIDFYTDAERLVTIEKPLKGKAMHLLSPFDNSLIQRRRTERLFNFNYQVECYVPEAKRIYGYFCLPILFGDEFIGRLDPKADRHSKTFFIYNLAFEPSFKNFEQALPLLAGKIKEFATFNNCNKIIIEKTEPKQFQKELKRLLK